MTAPPLVSIGLPVRNEEQHLAETLDSLLAQEYEHIEIVISDNASTDRTQEIGRAYAARDPRVSYHRQPVDRGASVNFNETFRLSSGEYFTWASGHDRRAPSAVRACVEAFEGRPDVVVCYPRSVLEDYAGRTIELEDDRLETSGLPAAQRLRVAIRDLGRCNAFHGVIRSSALRKTRLCRPCLGSDNVLLAELSVLGAVHQIEPRLFVRTENRPPESAEATATRLFVMLGMGTGRGTKHPYSLMAWEHVLGVWHVSEGVFTKVRLATVAAATLAVTLRRVLVSEWFPRLLRVAGAIKRRVRTA
jgi:hypothetical protein